MPDMPKHPRLTVRNGVFYHRAAIPADIRDTYGKREEIKSLGTRDPKEALKLVRVEAARVDALFDVHRKELERLAAPKLSSLTPEQIRVIGDTYYAMILEEDEQERVRGFADDPDFHLFTQDVEEVERMARELYARGQVPGFIKREYERVTHRLGLPWPLDDTSESWPLLSRAMVAASIKAIEDRKKRNTGHVVDTPEIIQLRPGGIPSKSVTLTSIFDAWQKDHLADGKAKMTVTTYRQLLKVFTDFLMHEDANRVTRKDIADFLNYLRHERQLSGKTVVDKYLAMLRVLYRTGISKVMIDNDPTERVRVKRPRRQQERPQGFTDREASLILSAALEAPEKLGRMSELNKLAIRWAPWICAYTGARTGEVCQLRKEDFGEEFRVPFLKITPEAGSVKTRQYRLVPVHPHLIEMGLLDLVKSCPSGPLFYEDDGEQAESGHRRSESVRDKVGQWVRKKVGISDTRIQPNHAWRHRFKTLARDVDMDTTYMDAIQGHTNGTAGAAYGENTMKALGREILKMPRYLVEDIAGSSGQSHE